MNHAEPDASSIDPFRWMVRSPWHRIPPLRWLRRRLLGFGIGYVAFDGGPQQLWREAMRYAPVSFRWFGRSLTLKDIDAELSTSKQWATAKQIYQTGDKIWPFVINADTLAMRLGYVIVRKRIPITGVVTIGS